MVLGVLVDVFKTLFHPASQGAMGDWTAHFIWKIFRTAANRWRGVLTWAGPVAFLAVILLWTSGVLFGFAFIYWPRIQPEFSFSPGTDPARHMGYLGALNISIDALITLTEGTNARFPGLGMLRGLEAMIGFGLLTASVSWLLSLYPVLETRRSLAHQASLLHHAEKETGVDMIRDAGEDAQQWLFTLAAGLTALRNEMAQFPISYYFHMEEPKTGLAGILPYVAHLADRAVTEDSPASLRLAGDVLGGAVVDFEELLARMFLRMPPDDEAAILRVYAEEQMYEPVALDEFIEFRCKLRQAA